MIKTLVLAALAVAPAARADMLAAAYQDLSAITGANAKPVLSITLHFEKGLMKVVDAKIRRVPLPTGNGSMRVELWIGQTLDSSYAIPDPLGYGHIELPDGTHGIYEPTTGIAYVYADLSKAGVTKLTVVPLSSGTRAVGGDIDLASLLPTACAAYVKTGATKPAACP